MTSVSSHRHQKILALGELVVIECFMDHHNPGDLPKIFNDWIANCENTGNRYFSPATCTRRVYVLSRSRYEDYPLPEPVNSRIRILHGKEAYTFLTEWGSGLKNYTTNFRDNRVFSELRKTWNNYQNSNSPRVKETGKFLALIMPDLFADISTIRSAFLEEGNETRLVSSDTPYEEAVKAARNACRYCATSRAMSLTPDRASLILPSVEEYYQSSLKTIRAKMGSLQKAGIFPEAQARFKYLESLPTQLPSAQLSAVSTRHGVDGIHNPNKPPLPLS